MSSAPKPVNCFDAANLRGPQQIVNVGKAPMGFGFSPDGNTVLVANHGDGTVTVIDLIQANVVRTFMAATGIETLALVLNRRLSPDAPSGPGFHSPGRAAGGSPKQPRTLFSR